jgi:putative PIG3 family NAD(P)H quinone oxidoreductase
MRAIVYTGAGGVEVLTQRDAPDPPAGPGQIRVRVRAAGLNRADVIQRRGGYPAPPGWPADIPGLEYAGEVESLGAGATRWAIGERVMGLVGGGAHAELVVVHEDEAIPIPPSLDWAAAAAVPESFLTAWDALVRGRVAAGERVLVHAVGSGLGTALLQLAKRLAATVLGTSRTRDKLARARELGLDVGIDASAGGWRDAVAEPVNLVVDVLGGPAFGDNLAVLAPRGRLVMLGFLQGPKVDTSLDPILRKRLEVIGSVMRTRKLAERDALAREFEAEVLPWFERGPAEVPSRGPIRPVVGAVFPIARIADAHRAMEGNEVFGKAVLTIDD